MLDDDVRIRPAAPEEAETLTDIAWRSKGYWEYPAEQMRRFREYLTISEQFLEENPSYLLENEETSEIMGFYSLENRGGRWWLENMWLVPEHIGSGYGGELFLHACETAETVGANELYIEADPNAEDFYIHMGAEKIGERDSPVAGTGRRLPVLRIKL